MKQAMAKSGIHEFSTCLTEEDVKQPEGKFFTGNDQCRYDHFTMSGGKIDAAMRCDATGGGTQVMTMKGNYSPESYSMRMEMKTSGGQGAAGAMTMRMRVDSKRVGACTPKELQVDALPRRVELDDLADDGFEPEIHPHLRHPCAVTGCELDE